MRQVNSNTVLEQSQSQPTFDSCHTPEQPYCTDLTCWCHFSVEYHVFVTSPLAVPGEVMSLEKMLARCFGIPRKSRYAANFKARAKACKEAAGYTCQKCGIVRGTELLSWAGNVWKVYMVAAHVNHDPENPDAVLICVCPRCHWRYYRRYDHKAVWIIERMKHRRLLLQKGYAVKGAL
jgi:hypothetical protein